LRRAAAKRRVVLFNKINLLTNTTPAFGHPSSAEEGSFHLINIRSTLTRRASI
jgi:hypothetical protein